MSDIVEYKTIPVGPMGRRWIARCIPCSVKLPGNYVDRESAEHAVGLAHENERHLARISAQMGLGE